MLTDNQVHLVKMLVTGEWEHIPESLLSLSMVDLTSLSLETLICLQDLKLVFRDDSHPNGNSYTKYEYLIKHIKNNLPESINSNTQLPEQYEQSYFLKKKEALYKLS